MNAQHLAWLENIIAQAKAAEHVWPEMAACEAALESGWGNSALAREAKNLFGLKQSSHPLYGTVMMPTREFINNQWTVVPAAWVQYDTETACFDDRMNTLRRLKNAYPHYAAALEATDPLTYIVEVSKSWSTDPQRAYKCQSIYADYKASLPTPDLSAQDL
jgi:flagellum-specific peptidoglycan hydrolase FlgJ